MTVAQGPLTRPGVRDSLAAYLLALADDELILGHRHSEWTGFAPDIESDVALSSVAQEEIGHARLFYEQAGGLLDATPDALAYGRPPEAFRNAVLVERPNGDWAFSIVRMFLYDHADAVRLDALAAGQAGPLADLAATLRREERYHLLYGEQWLRHLASATPGSRGRMQTALEATYAEALGVLDPVDGQDTLVEAGVIRTPTEAQRTLWRGRVGDLLVSAGLRVPQLDAAARGRSEALTGRAGRHGDDLRILLDEMRSVWRTEPGAKW